MHQLLCGVDDAINVDGYRIQILEVNAETVRLGLSTPDTAQVVHEIRLVGAQTRAALPACENLSSRPAIN